ncbi:integrase arm-type DNA-binding domain-containing protein [Variovorax sp. J22G73]|uniref:tyrosine-type recombinase/integrase n=1 Tax=unclassified Variovorax TaxID=663243 RepID=UPI000D5DFE58|nr:MULTISPECIES: integrase arm-type DNA-binding domain-containing protein [unclassified Variovorax]MDM0004432.1 integrase arm-type DNA-binding domain-containing protein [Variovorax sp. J22R203]MDM0095902.1 integrase arm-type DNA-binding domain-containing protein [Variovorax sp. J22G73]
MALTDTFVKQVKHKGSAIGERYADGGGMYLRVKAAGKYWRLDYRIDGKAQTLALGIYPEVSLAKARQRREKAREQLADGINPSKANREEKQARADAAKNDFASVASAWLTKTDDQRMAVTTDKLTTWLTKDINPYIGKMPVSAISPRDVLERVLRRMERRGALDSAARVRTLIGQVFRYAVAAGLAERDVTADLKGAIAVKKKVHHAAIIEPKAFGGLLRAIHGWPAHPTVSAALKLAPLVFVRPGELRTAEWVEVDLDGGLWTIPGGKTKMKRDLLVPLPTQATQILREQHALSGHGRYVFPSIRAGGLPMSDGTINAALRAMGYDSSTHVAHGFRATARTLLDEVLGERPDLIEAQLGHAVHGPLGRAYNRATHLAARIEMMQRWADYLDRLRSSSAQIAD